MKTENKKYKLKRWYPSLYNDFKVGDVVFFDKERGCYAKPNNRDTVLRKREVENNPDFWEEVKQPLFVTDDGVEVLSDIDNLYAVNLTCFNKTKNTLRHSGWLIENSAYKVFYHESNADEYIWRNKRLFSYQDIINSGIVTFADDKKHLMELAKERSEE